MKFDKRKDISPKYLLLTMTIICVCFIFGSYFAGDKLAFIREGTIKIISPIQKGINKIGNWTDSKMENLKKIEKLTKENDELKAELAAYKENATTYQNQLLELQELQTLYALDERYPELNKTAAHVYAKDSTSWFSTFYIDKGTEDGIFEGANVMCDDGLAGIVIETHKGYSKVRAIIDDKSNISARIMPANALCTVEGNVVQYENGYIIAKNIDKDASISVGDKVVTSSISDRYHAGITIGYIYEISEDSNKLTVTAYITPAVDFSNISDVLIITDKKNTFEEE